MGTGPFRWQDFRPNSGVTLAKHAQYFKQGRPYLDGIDIVQILDANTRYNAFLTGQVQLTARGGPGLTSDQASEVKSKGGGLKALDYNSLAFMFVDFNTTRPPWTDARVRRAVNLTISRQDAAAAIGRGAEIFGAYSPPGTPYALSDKGLSATPGYGTNKDADRAEAKSLLSAAGFGNGIDVTLTNNGEAAYAGQGEFVADQLSRIGIRAKIAVQDNATFQSTTAENHNFEIAVGRSNSGSGEPIRVYSQFFGASDYSGYESDKFSQLYSQMVGEADEGKRGAQAQQLEQILLTDVPRVMVLWFKAFVGIADVVKGYYPPLGNLNNNRYEDVWLNA